MKICTVCWQYWHWLHICEVSGALASHGRLVSHALHGFAWQKFPAVQPCCSNIFTRSSMQVWTCSSSAIMGTTCTGAANMILDVLAQMQQTSNSTLGGGHDRMALLVVGKPQTGRHQLSSSLVHKSRFYLHAIFLSVNTMTHSKAVSTMYLAVWQPRLKDTACLVCACCDQLP